MAPSDIAVSTFTTSAVAVYLMQRMKASPRLSWITDETKKVRIVLSALFAAFGAVGISYSWTPATHTFAITGLTLAAIGLALWHWASHFAMQEVIHAAVNQNKVNGDTVKQIASAVVATIEKSSQPRSEVHS